MTVRTIWRDHCVRVCEHSGIQLPEALGEYLVDLLCARTRDCEIEVQPSFAERYLLIMQNPRAGELVEFADSTLFFVSFVPERGRRRGLDPAYYKRLGVGAYYTAADIVEDERFIQMGNWWDTVSVFLHQATRPRQNLPELVPFH